MTEMLVALALLAFSLLPLSVSFVREQATARALYHRAVAIAIVDGEMEVLAAGAWRAFLPGIQDYSVRAEAARNLPAGRFVLTLTNGLVRLEWLPANRGGGGRVVRERKLPAEAAVAGGARLQPSQSTGDGNPAREHARPTRKTAAAAVGEQMRNRQGTCASSI